MALNFIEGQQLTRLLLGTRVDRAAATLPATTATAYFTVVGGQVAITGLVGEVTTVIQTQANNAKWTANPTTGTSADICAVLDITAKEVGGLFGITGLASDAMVGGTAGATVLPRNPVVVNIGTLDFNCAATNTGATKWSLWYIPLEEGAYVEAA